jgi:hypothetical protein
MIYPKKREFNRKERNVHEERKSLLPFVIFVSFVVISSSPLHAQTAAELERVLAVPAVSYGDAAWIVLSAAGALPPETSAGGAYGFAADNNWLPKKAAPEASVTLGGLSLLIMQSLNLKGGLMFSLFPNSRYSYRELVYRQVIQGRAYSTQKVPGERLLRILSRALEYSGDTAALAAEEERRLMMEGVNTSLEDAARKSEGISSGAEGILEYENEFVPE